MFIEPPIVLVEPPAMLVEASVVLCQVLFDLIEAHFNRRPEIEQGIQYCAA
jgi:hypothetical protein